MLPDEYAPPYSDPTQAHLAPQGDIGYWSYAEANLNMAKRRGTSHDVDTSRDWFIPEMNGKRGYRRWAISA
jgi:hypothetical protein